MSFEHHHSPSVHGKEATSLVSIVIAVFPLYLVPAAILL